MLPELPPDALVLVVDDMEANVKVLQTILGRAGSNKVTSITDARAAAAAVREMRPDLVVLDLHMPHLSGIQVLEAIRSSSERDPYLPVLVLTGDITDAAKREALTRGANDFLTKPFDAVEAVLRVRNLLETRRLHLAQRDQTELLEERVQERTRALEEAQLEILDRLALAGDFRDDVTGSHARRVGRLAGMVAEALGLPGREVELLRLAAPLHDIGKIGVRDAVLLKPGRLSAEEFEHIKSHVQIGERLLSGSHFPILQLGREIALMHHERWDGKGYLGTRGEAIPLAARIVSVADVFDALTHVRPYKPAWSVADSLEEIRRLRSEAFDPVVAEAFASLGIERWTVAELDHLGAPRRTNQAA